MNKSELREIVFVIQYHKLGMRDTAARALSALIRSARTKRSSAALWEYATMLQLDTHPDFIV
jgi:replication-associated recombination protein RarA